MLEAIREKSKGWIAKVILVLIIVPFALWGVDSYIQGGSEPPVAKVGDDEISQREFFRALQRQRDAEQEQNNTKVDIENKDFRTSVLDQLVDLRLIAGAAVSNGMTVPSGQLDEVIKSAPIFQENGQFSEQRFQAWLNDQGMGQNELARLIERESLAQQLQVGYGQGAVYSAASADRLSALMAQQREISEAVFFANDYLSSVTIDDRAVEAEYSANKGDYATPAMVRVEYLTLSAESMRAGVKIDEAAARQHYEASKARYQEPEQRRASHILIKTEAGADKAAAKSKAEKLLAQVKADPAKFAELAKQNSDDPGSAVNGGDLGSFVRETMVKPFGDAVFSMKTGAISDLVESEFGFHIIRLDGVTPGTLMSFEAVQQDIMLELSQQEAERKFADAAERFSNIVYEQPDSLVPAVKEFALTAQQSGWISRQQAEPAMLATPALMDALFSPEAIAKRQNTEAVEVSPGVLVSARVLEHKPAGTRPLAEVAANIRAKLALRAAQAKAIEAGQAALKASNAGQNVAGFGAPRLVSRMQPQDVPPEGIKAVLKANAAKLPVTVGVETRDGYRLYRITRVVEAAADENRRKMIQRDLTRLTAQEELRAYLAYVKVKMGVKINNAILEKKAE
jgi:peptidyl-prolyl cis-trans isomerase D